MPFALAPQLRRALDDELSALLERGREEFPSPGVSDFLTTASDLLARGKRTRGLAAACGWLAAGGDETLTETLLNLAVALELYQAHALVHDDIIDHATTRRGLPALHVAYATDHVRAGWRGDAQEYGIAAAILLGDYLLSQAIEAAQRACVASPAAWSRFCLLTREVAVGQYLDVRAEHDDALNDPVSAALAVLTHKSARYSVVHPVALGALVAGADETLVASLDAMTTPWGCAFQMRDDDLGVFGDPTVTGKPSGDDLREGKRTVLIALTLARLGSSERAWLDAQLRSGSWSDKDIERARGLIISSGAHADHEARLRSYADQGHAALAALTLPAAGANACRWLGDVLVDRDR